MKVMITGGLGYIGSHTVVELFSQGLDCWIVDDLSNSDLDTLEGMERIGDCKFNYINADLMDIEKVADIFKREQFDAVIHFAGLKAVGESVANPLMYYEHNLLTTINILKEMKKSGVKKFVFSSSATVYGNLTAPPIDEEAPTSILNAYGRTKLIIEEMLRDISMSDPEWSIAILRYFNPIGAHPSGLIGENTKGIPNNLMPYITQVASGARKHLNILGDNYDTHDGTGVRDYIHVMDLAEGHVKALQYLNKHKGSNTFNLGTGKGYSVLELVRTFERENGVVIPCKVIDRRPGDIAISYADPSKAEFHLNWKAKRGLQEMCKDVWRWEQSKYLFHT